MTERGSTLWQLELRPVANSQSERQPGGEDRRPTRTRLAQPYLNSRHRAEILIHQPDRTFLAKAKRLLPGFGATSWSPRWAGSCHSAEASVGGELIVLDAPRGFEPRLTES